MRDKLANLLEVKKIVTILLTFTFIYLAVIQSVSGMEFLAIFNLIVGYYFGQSTSAQSQIRTIALETQLPETQAKDKQEV